MTYRVFKRSATNFREFAKARKITVARVHIEATALRMCDAFNDNRTPRQIVRGTKLEYTKE